MAARPIAVFLGTRPEAIKLAPVIRRLRESAIPNLLVTTGQHRELADQVFPLFEVRPDRKLSIMRPGQPLDALLARTLTAVGVVIERERPSAIIIQGDTTSSFGSALAAFHHRVPIAHVEAGLRSPRLDLPFPEEMNRRGISVIARWHFAPTPGAAANLAAAGITEGVHVTGNTVVDALHYIVARDGAVRNEIRDFLDEAPFVIATAHRRESWEGRIEQIALALRDILDAVQDLRLVFATHPNPLARRPVQRVLGDCSRALVLDALDYATFIKLLSGSRLAITDSGGVQEEGPTLGIPVLVTRVVTERPEGVDAGAVRVVGTDRETIRRTALEILMDVDQHARMAEAGRALYGDGHAAERIVSVLAREVRI